MLVEALHEQCKYFCKTHITGTCDAVVIAVCPAAAVGHASVLALDHTICIKHRRTITIMNVLMPIRLTENLKRHSDQTNRKKDGVISPLHTGQHEFGVTNCSLRGQVSGRQFWCKQVHVRS